MFSLVTIVVEEAVFPKQEPAHSYKGNKDWLSLSQGEASKQHNLKCSCILEWPKSTDSHCYSIKHLIPLHEGPFHDTCIFCLFHVALWVGIAPT